MADLLTPANTRGNSPARWPHLTGADLDRLEDYASHFGEPLLRHLDSGFIALGAAISAVVVLTLG